MASQIWHTKQDGYVWDNEDVSLARILSSLGLASETAETRIEADRMIASATEHIDIDLHVHCAIQEHLLSCWVTTVREVETEQIEDGAWFDVETVSHWWHCPTRVALSSAPRVLVIGSHESPIWALPDFEEGS